MNELVESDQRIAAIARIEARIETVRRGELWMTAVWHVFSLLLFFFAVLFVSNAAAAQWPSLMLADGPILDAGRLLLGVMAAVVLVSAHRRAAQIRQIELGLLRAELRDVRQGMSHS